MTSKVSVTVSATSRIKSVLHALKYFSENVGGYIYGSVVGGNVAITNVYPVVHSAPAGPVLDLAASFIDALGESGGIIGYYYGNNIRGDKDLPIPNYVLKVAAAIAESQNQSICLVVCINDELEWDISRFMGTELNLEKINSIKYDKDEKDIKGMIDNYVKDKRHLTSIFDMEDHLDDARVSFTNSWLEEIAKKNI